jgi:CheY-like chemotaxis protein
VKTNRAAGSPARSDMIGKRILFADDDMELLALYESMASRRGYEVIECINGLEALRAAASHEPDVIVLDVRMPELDGRDVIAKLKADPATRGIPILVVTGVVAYDVREVCIRHGADDYLLKPIDFRELFRRIEYLLGKQLHEGE